MRTTARTRSRRWRAAVLAIAGATLAACGDPCEDLQVICDRCQDPNKKADCERSVDEDSDDLCEQNIDSYDSICN